MSSAAAVLAVDDNATIRRAISMRLGARGFEVVTAEDGDDALALVEQRSFDLIILDLKMPRMRGEEVLRRLRQRFSATELPVIVLAASDDQHDISRSRALGANDYVVKPGDLPILVTRIHTQLKLRDTVAALERQNALLHAAANGPEHRVPQAEAVPFALLHDHTPMPCFTLSGDGFIVHANRYGAEVFGYDTEMLRGRSVLDLCMADDRTLALDHLAAARHQPDTVQRWDMRHRKASGATLWMRNTARAVRDGNMTLVLLTCADVDDAYRLNDLLSFQAHHDELTGLANRKSVAARLAQVIESAHTEHTEHALLVVDVDQFKLVNDAGGPQAGDELLKRIARVLRRVARKRDVVARIGGDEFAVLLEDCPLTAAQACAETLRRSIALEDFGRDGHAGDVTVSIGIVPIDHACDTAGNVLGMADAACYAAKDAGRNRAHTYQADNVPVLRRHGEMRWAARIHEALAEDRFDLCLQRIAPLAATNAGLHFEVLLRMRDELGLPIVPGEFLPAAERYQLCARIDRWVVDHVFAWLADDEAALAALELCCINLSAQSLAEGELLEHLLTVFAHGAVPAQKICFEITETAAIADLAQATRFMQRLKEHGCRFALDDFGSGFSSLAYLKQLPVDYLKIDGAFVRDMASASIDLAMVRAINDIGHLLGKQTVAEFVEDAPTLALLGEIGVDYAQGYAIGRPLALVSRVS